MTYSVTQYNSEDLSELADFLNRNWEFDTIHESQLEEKLNGDPNWMPELTYVCRSINKIIGFMQGVIRDIRGTRYGYIKLMAVEKTYRRKGIAGTMYQKLENNLQSLDVNVVRIYDVPLNYWMPGIDPRYTPALCFAEKMGFERFADRVNMLTDLYSHNWDTDSLEQELKSFQIEVKRADKADKKGILDFISKEWALWSNEIEMAFKDDPPSIHIALLDGEIKAFSAHNANNKGMGWFGPMGTHPDMRGKGIGAILLKRCLKDMKEQGLRHSIIPWVDPICFYAHHANARIDRIFWRYEKKLE
ncbi:GNAT family N-acetyltransferase [Bacteroidota bacterium]